MEYQKNRAWLEVSLDALEHNFRLLSALVGPDCSVMAVLKCNASGMGAPRIARELALAGCRFFGVATVEEAVELRDDGVTQPILLFGAIEPDHVPVCLRYGITLPVFDRAYAATLSERAQRCGGRLDVHLKVDTGLSRYGISLEHYMEEAVQQALAMAALPGLALRGVYTHAANAGAPEDDPFTLRQFSLFQEFTGRLARSGLRLLRHFANSPALLRFPQTHLDMARAGMALNGFTALHPDPGLWDVASLRTKIVSIKELLPGDTLGYGRLFTVERKTNIGILPFGYGDGIHRCCANRAFFLVRGQKARVIGKLCMDMCFIDITDIPQAAVGDVVTVFGRDGETFQPITDIADLYPGTPPELTTALGRRIPRFYLRNGGIVGRA